MPIFLRRRAWGAAIVGRNATWRSSGLGEHVRYQAVAALFSLIPEIVFTSLSLVTSAALNSRISRPQHIPITRSEAFKISGISEEITMIT